MHARLVQVVPYNIQLLWLEGKPFLISRPQNKFVGRLQYTSDTSVFITTLEADIRGLKPGVHTGDVEMLVKRLKLFKFHAPLANVDRTIGACVCCFCKLVLSGSAEAPMLPVTSKRGPPGSTGLTPPPKKAASYLSWRVDDVVAYLRSLELGHLEAAFRANGVDGPFPATLSEEDLVTELGLTRLQARKVMMRLGE
jgi:hypothetical protein